MRADVVEKAAAEGIRLIVSVDTGIRANAVALGIIKTPMHPAETHEALSKMHPIGRMGEISDVTDAILFLDGAPFVTGEILHVDGGQAAGH